MGGSATTAAGPGPSARAAASAAVPLPSTGGAALAAHLHSPPRVHQQVGALEVAVQDVLAVQAKHPLCTAGCGAMPCMLSRQYILPRPATQPVNQAGNGSSATPARQETSQGRQSSTTSCAQAMQKPQPPPWRTFAASSAMLRRRVQLRLAAADGDCAAACRQSKSEPREQNSARREGRGAGERWGKTWQQRVTQEVAEAGREPGGTQAAGLSRPSRQPQPTALRRLTGNDGGRAVGQSQEQHLQGTTVREQTR